MTASFTLVSYSYSYNSVLCGRKKLISFFERSSSHPTPKISPRKYKILNFDCFSVWYTYKYIFLGCMECCSLWVLGYLILTTKLCIQECYRSLFIKLLMHFICENAQAVGNLHRYMVSSCGNQVNTKERKWWVVFYRKFYQLRNCQDC